MKIGIRLSSEALNGIAELKDFYNENNFMDGLKITNGATIGIALMEIKHKAPLNKYDWESVIYGNKFLGINNKAEKSSIRTSLTLDEDVISDINELKTIFPHFTKTKYVTTSYVIRIIVRAALNQNNLIKKV